MAVRSDAYVCSCMIPGMPGSNPPDDVDVCLVCLYHVV